MSKLNDRIILGLRLSRQQGTSLSSFALSSQVQPAEVVHADRVEVTSSAVLKDQARLIVGRPPVLYGYASQPVAALTIIVFQWKGDLRCAIASSD